MNLPALLTSPFSTVPYKNTPYRPDIDGLRAIAVLAVVIFHYAPGRLPGGFVGVDVSLLSVVTLLPAS